jgi:hypothetical protein
MDKKNLKWGTLGVDQSAVPIAITDGPVVGISTPAWVWSPSPNTPSPTTTSGASGNAGTNMPSASGSQGDPRPSLALSTGVKAAVGVVIPLVVLGLLALAFILLRRRRRAATQESQGLSHVGNGHDSGLMVATGEEHGLNVPTKPELDGTPTKPELDGTPVTFDANTVCVAAHLAPHHFAQSPPTKPTSSTAPQQHHRPAFRSSATTVRRPSHRNVLPTPKRHQGTDWIAIADGQTYKSIPATLKCLPHMSSATTADRRTHKNASPLAQYRLPHTS